MNGSGRKYFNFLGVVSFWLVGCFCGTQVATRNSSDTPLDQLQLFMPTANLVVILRSWVMNSEGGKESWKVHRQVWGFWVPHLTDQLSVPAHRRPQEQAAAEPAAKASAGSRQGQMEARCSHNLYLFHLRNASAMEVSTKLFIKFLNALLCKVENAITVTLPSCNKQG